MGVDVFKTDGGEHIHSEHVRFFDNSNGLEGKNKYARDYISAYKKFVGKERVIFSRAGFSGQHRISIQWAGDQQSRPEEMKSVLKAGLSAAATGIIFWGFDIAGFAGALPSMDLYRRATQFACFCPIMQWHSEPDGGQFKDLMAGSSGENERSPWNIAKAYDCPEIIDEMRYWHKLREELRPYIYETEKKCVADKTPMMKPLFYLWPEAENVLNCDDEYMFGDDYLVAPYMEENQTHRDVYLPSGTWKHFFSNDIFAGEQVINVGGDGKIPVFIKLEE
jgi:alpha-D-xyloside xylohydrolase